jgi:hypothetical protein
MNSLNHCSRCPSRDSNLSFPECKSEALQLQLACSVKISFVKEYGAKDNIKYF